MDEREGVPADFYRGLIVAIPISIALWALIGTAVWHLITLVCA